MRDITSIYLKLTDNGLAPDHRWVGLLFYAVGDVELWMLLESGRNVGSFGHIHSNIPML